MTNCYVFDKDTLVSLIQDAFDAGEQWGTSYAEWFAPSEKDYKTRLDEATNNILENYKFAVT